MQAAPSVKRSPWALRATLVCAAVLLIGLMLISSQADAVFSEFDPRESHEYEAQGEGTFVVEGLQDTCYRFYQHEDNNSMDVELHRIEGSALVEEPLGQSNCSLDWQPMAADGSRFYQQASWTLNDSGDYALVVTCDEGCSDDRGWLVSVDRMQDNMFANTSLLVGSLMCCFGLFSSPIALIFFFSSKPKQAPKVMMVNAEGQLVPVTDLTPEQAALMDGQVAQQQQQSQVAPPFADTVESAPADAFVDGLPDVAAGQMLTTEQVFALMNGDVEGAKEHTKTQRNQINSAEHAIKEAANAAAIASWDEGVDLAKNEHEEPAKNSTSKPVERQQTTPGSKEFWKDWDDQ